MLTYVAGNIAVVAIFKIVVCKSADWLWRLSCMASSQATVKIGHLSLAARLLNKVPTMIFAFDDSIVGRFYVWTKPNAASILMSIIFMANFGTIIE